MPHPQLTSLPHRGAIRIAGPDRIAFLQSLISNDIAKVTENTAIYAALLTPQGKFLHDLFILADGDSFLIDCERGRAEDLINRLTAYKLRSKIAFENLNDTYDIWAVWNGDNHTPLSFPDPRLPELGRRAFLAKNHPPVQTADFAAYDSHRIKLGVADGSRDLEIDKSTLAEGNFDYLNGVDWKKGCYVGQELTARMHYRGLAKKRLFPVRIEGALPPESAIFLNDTEVGALRSRRDDAGLALLTLAAAEQAERQKIPLICGPARLFVRFPSWLKKPETIFAVEKPAKN